MKGFKGIQCYMLLMSDNKITRFSIFGFKGGVGKSTVAYLLARDLAKRHRVLLVDRDYTNTIGKIYGLDTGIINVLADGVEGKFLARDGNLKVLSLISFQPRTLPALEDFARSYSQVLEDVDVVVTDNPPNLDDITRIEAQGYYRARGEFYYNAIVVTTPGLALRLTLEHLNEISSSLRSWVPEATYTRLAAFVVNMARENVDVEVPRKVVIPFYRDMLFKGFREVPEPKEMQKVLEYAEQAIAEGIPVL